MIALYKGKSVMSRMIRTFNWSPYSHASWWTVQDGEYEAWRKGVTRAANLGEFHEAGTEIDLFNVRGMTAVQELRALDFLRLQLGKKYDLRGVLGFVSRRPAAQNPDRWFCSELIFAACKHAGIDLLYRIPAWKVYPGLMAVSPVLEHVGSVTNKSNKERQNEDSKISDDGNGGRGDCAAGTECLRGLRCLA